MRFGVLTPQDAPLGELVERWRTVDELGFDSIWVADHLANPYTRRGTWHEGWACLAAMATTTHRARIGTLVSAASHRDGVVLAKAAVTVDHLSNGRIDLGIGAGGSGLDYELTGIDASPRATAARLRDRVERVVRYLYEEPLEPSPVQPRLPLTIGGQAPGTLRLAARYADTWNTYGGGVAISVDEAVRLTRERMDQLDAFCAELGRDPASLRRSLLIGYRHIEESPWRSEEAFVDVVGRWREIGVDELIFFYPPDFLGWDPHVAAGVLEHVAREVMPELRQG